MTQSFLSLATLSVLIFFCCSGNKNGDNEEIVRIATYAGDKKAALSFTFDDNCPSSFSTIAPLMREHGFSATFFIIAGQVRTEEEWNKWRNLSADGFEIGNHSLNHISLTGITDTSTLRKEINHAHEIISHHIKIPPFSFAHPGHSTNETVNLIVTEKHFATRAFPQGFCRWWGVTSGSTEEMFENDLKSCIKTREWFVMAAHGVDDCWEPMTTQFLRSCLRYAKSVEGDVWIDNFENISKYKIERNNTNITRDKKKDRLIITLDSPLDTSVFNHSLTLVINKPKNTKMKLLPGKGTSIEGITLLENKILVNVPPKGRLEVLYF